MNFQKKDETPNYRKWTQVQTNEFDGVRVGNSFIYRVRIVWELNEFELIEPNKEMEKKNFKWKRAKDLVDDKYITVR